MRLDLSLVEVFCCVYDESNISKAALKLRLSQPTVSCHVKNLENYIGAKLFDRLPRRLVPTRAGQLLYQRGCVILKEKEAALQDLERFLQRIEGALIISGSNIPGEYILPQLVTAFHAHFPAVKVELKILDARAVCREVLSGESELGFSCAKIDTVGLDFRPFASGELALVVPNNKKWSNIESIALDRLAGEPFIAREAGSIMRSEVEKRIGSALDDFNVVGVFGSNNAIREALKSGLGVSVVSPLAVKYEIANGELKIVKIEGADASPSDYFAVTNKNLTRSPIADAFLDYVLGTATFARPALKASM